MKSIALGVALLIVTSACYAQNSRKKEGGGGFEPGHAECITPAQQAAIQRTIDSNIKVLEQQKGNKKRKKKSAKANKPTATSLIWPIQQAGANYFNCDAISNYVDHDVAYPSFVQDWNCGTRTYDLASGYNHGGTDIFLWPFYWHQMEEENAKIVAAAPGVIVAKHDGYFDKNCAMGGGQWNAVYVQHADGSVAWYGHMKKNSLTTKLVGASVSAGEFLGFVGSSGSSTGPHLHFELHTAGGDVIDQYTGPCNPGATWWSSTQTYNKSQVNALMTHSAEVLFPTCPTSEVINACDTFYPGDLIYYYAYYRDQLTGQVSSFKVTRPDGSIDDTWNFTASDSYVAAYRYWFETIPSGVPFGEWKLSVTYQGNTYTHKYYILSPTVNTGNIAERNIPSFYPNPVKDMLYIDVKGASQIQLIDFLGHTVLTAAGDTRELNVAALPAGMYYFRVLGGETQQVKKLLKL